MNFFQFSKTSGFEGELFLKLVCHWQTKTIPLLLQSDSESLFYTKNSHFNYFFCQHWFC